MWDGLLLSTHFQGCSLLSVHVQLELVHALTPEVARFCSQAVGAGFSICTGEESFVSCFSLYYYIICLMLNNSIQHSIQFNYSEDAA